MTLDAVVRSVKDTLKEELWNYPGRKGYAMGNGIRTAVGYFGMSYFDSDILKATFGAYMIIKGVQFVKDVVRYVW
ncbi:hypothetical protein KY343_01520 [Candidatus Woesearchaeota archaeon]|nr:hypothetical protein [Candidatus Woesearchaeota archaeon]